MDHQLFGCVLYRAEAVKIGADGIKKVCLMFTVIFYNRADDLTADGVCAFPVFNIEQDLVDSQLVIVHHILLEGIGYGGQDGGFGVEVAGAQVYHIGIAVSYADGDPDTRICLTKLSGHMLCHFMEDLACLFILYGEAPDEHYRIIPGTGQGGAAPCGLALLHECMDVHIFGGHDHNHAQKFIDPDPHHAGPVQHHLGILLRKYHFLDKVVLIGVGQIVAAAV